MVFAWSQDLPIDAGLYARITARLGTEPMEGLLMHLAVRKPEGGLRYIDVWESEELCDRAFEERVHPAVHAAFAESDIPFPPVEPPRHVLDVIEVRGAAARGILT